MLARVRLCRKIAKTCSFISSKKDLLLEPNEQSQWARLTFSTTTMLKTNARGSDEDDFFGIVEERRERPLKQPEQSQNIQTSELFLSKPTKDIDEFEQQIQMPFGLVRFDSVCSSPSLSATVSNEDVSRILRGEKVASLSELNRVASHAETERLASLVEDSENTVNANDIEQATNNESKSINDNFFDELYFGKLNTDRRKDLEKEVKKTLSRDCSNVFDDYYFSELNERSNSTVGSGELVRDSPANSVSFLEMERNFALIKQFDLNEHQQVKLNETRLVDKSTRKKRSKHKTAVAVQSNSDDQTVMPQLETENLLQNSSEINADTKIHEKSLFKHETTTADAKKFSEKRLSKATENTARRDHETEAHLKPDVATTVSNRAENSKEGKKMKSQRHTDNELMHKEGVRTIMNTNSAEKNPPKTAYQVAMELRMQKRGVMPAAKPSTESISDGRQGEGQAMDPNKVKWQGKIDSKGFRILTAQVIDMQHVPEDTVLQILKKNIIFENEHLVAINKPYGLPTHGGPGVHNSVGKFVGALFEHVMKRSCVDGSKKPTDTSCVMIDKDKSDHSRKRGDASRIDDFDGDDSIEGNGDRLYLVHRLDKETTGVMVMGKTKDIAFKLRELFRKREVAKKYWVLTKGTPDPTEGIIDIPMDEGTVGDKHRMALRPNYPKENRLMFQSTPVGHGLQAVTKYRVLDSNTAGALVECEPATGVKHQIRCHLAFALNTPILGDHKYSHFSRLAPQRLPPETLQRLGIRQAKVRHLPMHLHAHSLVLPEFLGGRNIFIRAPLPKHFVQNMKWLRLNVPSH